MLIKRRLTEKEEKKLFSDKDNIGNLEKFEDDLLPFFFYNNSSNKKIKNRIDNIKTGKPNTFLDKLLKLNNQKRAFFEVSEQPMLDESFILFVNLLNEKDVYRAYLTQPDNFKKNIRWSDFSNSITDYDNFLSNKIKFGKQNFKLFKFLLNKGVLKNNEVEHITTNKGTKEISYVCLSRNPIDYLFASTNQSFKSCLSFDKNGTLPCLGLAGLILDPNRFIMFMTVGNKKKCILRELPIKHFTYLSRWWCLLNKDNRVLPLRGYPGKEGTSYRNRLIKQIGLSIFDEEYRRFKSKYGFYPVKFEDNKNIAMIYLDSIGLSFDKNKASYCGETGRTGDFHDGVIDTHLRFKQLQTFYDIIDGNYCYYCDKFVYSEHYYYSPYHKICCHACFKDRFFYCYSCGEVHELESRKIGLNDHWYCYNCWDYIYNKWE